MDIGREHADMEAASAAELHQSFRLWVVLVANLLLVGALIAVGAAAHSVGVWAEGADYLADAAGIGVSLLAIKLSSLPPSPRHPEGYPRATNYAALVNAGWLLIISILVAVEAIDRLLAGVHEVHGLPVLIVSGTAAVVMAISALILGDDDDDLNRRAVLVDTVADAAAAAGVAITGGVIFATHGTYWLDPAVAILIATIVSYHAVRLLRRIWPSLVR